MNVNNFKTRWSEFLNRFPDWFLGFVLGVGLGASVIILWIFSPAKISKILSGYLSSLTISIGGVATLALAILYGRQQQILNQQAKTQKRQADIQQRQIQLQYKPSLIIQELQYNSDNQIICLLRNIGKDLAKDIHIVCHGRVKTDSEQFDLIESNEFELNGDKRSYKPKFSPLQTNESTDLSRMVHLKGDILETNSKGNYVCNPIFFRSDKNEEKESWSGIPISDVAENFDQTQFDRLKIQFSFVYRGVTDDVYTNIIGTLSISFSELDISDELEEIPTPKGMTIGRGGSPDSENWSLEEIFDRGSFNSGGFMSFISEEEIKEQVVDEGLGFLDNGNNN